MVPAASGAVNPLRNRCPQASWVRRLRAHPGACTCACQGNRERRCFPLMDSATGSRPHPYRYLTMSLVPIACLSAAAAHAQMAHDDAVEKGSTPATGTSGTTAVRDSDASCARPARWLSEGPGFVVMEVTRHAQGASSARRSDGALWKVVQTFNASTEGVTAVTVLIVGAPWTQEGATGPAPDLAAQAPVGSPHVGQEEARPGQEARVAAALAPSKDAWLVAGVPVKHSSGGVTLLVRDEDRIDPDMCPDALALLGPGIIPFKPSSAASTP